MYESCPPQNNHIRLSCSALLWAWWDRRQSSWRIFSSWVDTTLLSRQHGTQDIHSASNCRSGGWGDTPDTCSLQTHRALQLCPLLLDGTGQGCYQGARHVSVAFKIILISNIIIDDICTLYHRGIVYILRSLIKTFRVTAEPCWPSESFLVMMCDVVTWITPSLTFMSRDRTLYQSFSVLWEIFIER